jgi:ubiquinone/menaquinone biosynthesis C-methylase UbiE
MNIPTAILLLLLQPLAALQNHDHNRPGNNLHGQFSDPSTYITMLDSPGRDLEQKPDEVLAAMDIQKGETIADIGAGSGYFAFRFSLHVGEKGRVYAVDIDPGMILHMNRTIRDRKIENVITVLSTPVDPLLANNSIDRFFICNTWHHVADRSGYIGRMKDMLRPGGQIVIIDYFKRQMPAGPPPAMKLARSKVVEEMQENGFLLSEEHTFLPYQYFLVFKRK